MIILAALTALQSQPALARPTSTPEVVVRGRHLIEDGIRRRGWLIIDEGVPLTRLDSDQVVCRRLSEIGTRLPARTYTCGPVRDWEDKTYAARDWLRCIQVGSHSC